VKDLPPRFLVDGRPRFTSGVRASRFFFYLLTQSSEVSYFRSERSSSTCPLDLDDQIHFRTLGNSFSIASLRKPSGVLSLQSERSRRHMSSLMDSPDELRPLGFGPSGVLYSLSFCLFPPRVRDHLTHVPCLKINDHE
jgi:hypothetical protein